MFVCALARSFTRLVACLTLSCDVRACIWFVCKCMCSRVLTLVQCITVMQWQRLPGIFFVSHSLRFFPYCDVYGVFCWWFTLARIHSKCIYNGICGYNGVKKHTTNSNRRLNLFNVCMLLRRFTPDRLDCALNLRV